MNSNNVDMVHYMGFQSYGVHPVATKKPGLGDYYVKDAYKDISNYNKRRVDYYDDKIRYNSIYDTDYLKTLKEETYFKGPDQTIKSDLAKYNYVHDANLSEMVTDKPKWKDEKFTKEKFAETQREPNRQKVFSNWMTTYDHDNKVTEDLKNNTDFKKSEIDTLFKPRYHRYHCTSYKNEHHTAMGIHGDIPFEKYFWDSQPKFHSTNYEIGLGTTKPTEFIPGYCGFVPTNKFTVNHDLLKDPYFNVNKTNHLLNYKTKLPHYQGFIPKNPQNIKGNSRPYCLSTKEETFS